MPCPSRRVVRILHFVVAASIALACASDARALTIDAAAIAFNPKKTDAFTVKGRFAPVDLQSVAEVAITFGTFSQTIPLGSFTAKKGTFSYKGPKGVPGLATLVLDTVKGKFAASGKNLTLAPFDNPAAFHLSAGVVLDECSTLSFAEKKNKRKLAAAVPACGFAGEPTATPAAFFVNTPTDVRVQIAVVDDLALDLASLAVLRLDDALQPVGAPLCALFDDGSAAHGDDTAVDGVFSCRFTALEPQAAHVRLAVRALRDTVPVLSPSFFIDAVTPLTDAEITTVMTTQDAAGDLWEAAVAELGPGRKALKQTVAGILELPGVASARIAADGFNIAIEYTNGLAGGLDLDPVGLPATLSASTTDVAASAPAPVVLHADASDPAAGVATAISAVQASQATPVVGNDKVLIWAAFENESDSAKATFQAVAAVFQQATCPKFQVTVLKNEECTLASIDTFRDYGTIVILTHGGQPKPGGDVAFMSREKATLFSTWYTHATDLKLKRLLVNNSPRFPQKVGYFVVFPSFVSSRNPGGFPNSIVFVGVCTMGANRTMANAFLGSGALAYLSFDATVNGNFLEYVVPAYFQALIAPPRSAAGAFGAVPYKTYKDYVVANHVDPKLLAPESRVSAPTKLTLLSGDNRVAYPCGSPGPGLVESVTIAGGPMAEKSGTVSLDPNAQYRMVVSGTNHTTFESDFADYDVIYCFASSYPSFCQSPFPHAESLFFGTQIADETPPIESVLEFTGSGVPPYAPSHTYEFPLSGKAGKLFLKNWPQIFPDGGTAIGGSYTVQIFRDQ